MRGRELTFKASNLWPQWRDKNENGKGVIREKSGVISNQRTLMAKGGFTMDHWYVERTSL